MNCTIRQAVGVWDELVNAYHGRNGYGGQTAEIYSYRLEEYSPSIHRCAGQIPDFLLEDAIKIATEAAQNLLELIKLFQESYDCDVFIYEETLAKWEEKLSRYSRYHVKVMRKEK